MPCHQGCPRALPQAHGYRGAGGGTGTLFSRGRESPRCSGGSGRSARLYRHRRPRPTALTLKPAVTTARRPPLRRTRPRSPRRGSSAMKSRRRRTKRTRSTDAHRDTARLQGVCNSGALEETAPNANRRPRAHFPPAVSDRGPEVLWRLSGLLGAARTVLVLRGPDPSTLAIWTQYQSIL